MSSERKDAGMHIRINRSMRKTEERTEITVRTGKDILNMICGRKGVRLPNSNEKGTVMVEAAVILPLIIMTVVAVIYILIFLDRQVSVRCSMHMHLWAERGIVSKTSETHGLGEERFPVYSSKKITGGTVYYSGSIYFAKRGLLRKTFTKTSEGRLYWLREKTIIRAYDLAKEASGRDKHDE